MTTTARVAVECHACDGQGFTETERPVYGTYGPTTSPEALETTYDYTLCARCGGTGEVTHTYAGAV